MTITENTTDGRLTLTVTYDARDSKGRTFGGKVVIKTTPVDGAEYARWSADPAGTMAKWDGKICAWIEATRDGVRFGSSGPGQAFASVDAARAWAKEAFAAQAVRVARKAK